jgi:hypothetical protein
VTLVKLLRAGELRAIWVPDTVHEAVRDLTRARAVHLLGSKPCDQGGFFVARPVLTTDIRVPSIVAELTRSRSAATGQLLPISAAFSRAEPGCNAQP